MKISQSLKRNKKGITAGAVFGIALVFYMKFTGAITLASASRAGFIDKVITNVPLTDMEFIKLLVTAVVIFGFLGYVIQDRFIKR